MRHFKSYIRNKKLDEETRVSHLAHAICCLLFLLWFDIDGQGKDDVEDLRQSFENLFPKLDCLRWIKSRQEYISKDEPDIARQYTRDFETFRAGVIFNRTAH
jgi:hypothetical protein